MRILILNPYHAGSHAAFVEGWAAHSRHTFEVLTLPGHHWKWRMRHAAATFAGELSGTNAHDHGTKHQAADADESSGGGVQASGGAVATSGLDAIWCTSMLDLAAFYGLCDERLRGLPAMVYFHENQLTYPTRQDDVRDHHFAITHLTSAMAAIQRGGNIAWNSAFQRDSFLVAARKLLQKMPGRELDHGLVMIEANSVVLSPGVEIASSRADTPGDRGQGPLHILWVGRWEHDKDPDAFFAALKKLKKRGVRFRLSVIGESFEQVPECFATARKRFAHEIVRWGFQASRDEYDAALREADVVVSTARHEFFGIAIVEAVMAGCFPVLPHRLAYPEVFGGDPQCFYDGTPEGLAGRLIELDAALPTLDAQVVERYRWEHAAGRLDEAMDAIVG